MVEEPDRIREDIELTRSDLARNVDALADRTIPTRVAQRRWTQVKDRVHSVSEKVMGSRTGESYRSASGGVHGASGTVHGIASQTADKAQSVASDVAETVRDAPQTVARQAQGNPVAAGLIAFGAGLLAASLVPATNAERQAGQRIKENAGELLEPVRGPLTESAQEMKQNLSESVSGAATQVKESAKDAGQAVKEQVRSS